MSKSSKKDKKRDRAHHPEPDSGVMVAPREKIELGERQPTRGYVEPQWRRHLVPEVY